MLETAGNRPEVEFGGETTRKVRVLVVDDHRSVAESLAMAIDLQPDLQCAGIAGTVAEARAMLMTTCPDVALTDVRLPDGDGVEGARRFLELRPDLRVIVLTAHADVEVMARAAAAGVAGFLPKESGIGAVLNALRRAGVGEMTVEATVLSAVLDRLKEAHPHPTKSASTGGDLTEREREVLNLLSGGLDPQAIARRLGISLHTCRGHVKSILAKLEAHSQLQAVVRAAHLGIINGLGEG